MRIVVLGGTGLIGSRICDHLSARGHDAVPVSRATGVDARRGSGLPDVVRGADVVVDALDVKTMSRRKATGFFTAAARNVVEASRAAGVGRIVCVSIHGVEDPSVTRASGYYAAKAAQLAAYEAGPVPVTGLMSTQWFELVELMVRRTSVGPVTLLPTMAMAPLAVDDAAGAVADAATDPDGGARVTVRGAQEATALDVARAVLADRGEVAGRRPGVLRQLPYLGAAIAGGALVPEAADVVVPGGVEAWLGR